MKTSAIKVILLFISLISLSSCTQTFYIVRHAEKVDESDDPILSADGIRRCAALNEYLRDKGIDKVYTSFKKRTIMTGLYATATLESISFPNLNPKSNVPQVAFKQGTYPEIDILVTALKNDVGYEDKLVVGHTDSIPLIIKELTGQFMEGSEIPPNQYGDLFIIKKNGNDIKVTRTRFGK